MHNLSKKTGRQTKARKREIRRAPAEEGKLTRDAWRDFFKAFQAVFSRGEITQNSIIIAYYLLLSIFPIIIIAGNLLPLLNISEAPIARYLALVFPEQVQSFIMPIVTSLLSNPSGGFISFGILIAIWAFSRLINSLRIAMNKIYGVRKEEMQNSFFRNLGSRLLTFFTTSILVFGLFIFVFIVAFGQQILKFLAPIFKFSMEPFNNFLDFKWPIILIILTLVIAYLNYFLPNIRIKKRSLWPGVLITLIGWVLLSLGFSLYIRYFGTSFSNYGIVGTFIIFMLWLNFSSLVMLFGVVVNSAIDYYRNDSIDYSAGRLVDLIKKMKAL